jgi:SM-20-related protein
MLNPNLNKAAIAEEFARDGRVRIKNLLDEDIAERIRDICLNNVPYEYLTNVNDKSVVITPDEMKNMDRQQLGEIQQHIMDAAANGVGFFYCGYKMNRAKADTGDEKIDFLNSVFEYLNSEEMLSFVAEVSGCDDLQSTDGQFTRYSAGQFLTRHRDDVTAEKRRLAYVISFSRDWHPDWGGLLQFFEDDGTPRDAWAPIFNSMALFDVRHVHSVTFVAPFHAQPRLSLTGWFRAKPL